MNQMYDRHAHRKVSAVPSGIGWTGTFITGLLLLAPVEPALALMERTPMESVKNTIAEVILILNRDELKQPGRAVDRRQAIERVVRDRVSYEEMAKRALGTPWSALSHGERREFVDLFVQLLRDTFAGKIDAYADEQVLYLSEQREADMAEVRTKLTGPKIDTHLDFRLADRRGEWLVYDVVIDGASIVSNYRAQFASIIRDYAYKGLVERMKQKTLVVKAFETTMDQ
jgi:phospholipid transport system substrate-binding protein